MNERSENPQGLRETDLSSGGEFLDEPVERAAETDNLPGDPDDAARSGGRPPRAERGTSSNESEEDLVSGDAAIQDEILDEDEALGSGELEKDEEFEDQVGGIGTGSPE